MTKHELPGQPPTCSLYPDRPMLFSTALQGLLHIADIFNVSLQGSAEKEKVPADSGEQATTHLPPSFPEFRVLDDAYQIRGHCKGDQQI